MHMSIKNVLFPGGDDLTDNDFLSADSGHMRLNKARVAFFNGGAELGPPRKLYARLRQRGYLE